jgi:hypothetical protein
MTGKAYTANFKEKTGSTSGVEPVYLLEISHPQLVAPIRVVNDTQDITSNGDLFIACAFRVKLPDDMATQMPRAELAVDNIGRELTQWLEASNGGRGAQVRMMQVMRDTPDIIEMDVTLDLFNVRQNMIEVSGELGYQQVLDQPALTATQTPENQPNIY